MRSPSKNTFAKNEVTNWPIPNYWDWIALTLVIAVVCLLGFGAHSMLGQYHLGQAIPISLDPRKLPHYALLTVLRMLVALCFSLLFTFIFATWAAKSRAAERIIIPGIDILQSVPVLGFLSITVVGFIALFHGSMLGPESAAIFAIFVAQAWNIALSFYQSLKMLPEDLHEASRIFQLSAWQKFWRIEVPFAMPGLVWNIMLSMSSSWIFLVASEAISVANQKIYLPGVGSYIATAILHKDKLAIFYVIITMLVVITLYDQILFRPLVAWADKFKMGAGESELEPESWLLNMFQRTRLFRFFSARGVQLGDAIVNFRWLQIRRKKRLSQKTLNQNVQRFLTVGWNIILAALVVLALVFLLHYIFSTLKPAEGITVVYDGFLTLLRVLSAILISTVVFVPIGVWVGLNPRASLYIQPMVQFFASFPMNLIFPVVIWAILKYALNINIWCTVLMMLGAQWFILFNVIAGATAMPKNLHHAVKTLNVRGLLWWRKLILPGIFPYYITGAITAAGGAWNISILAESVSWGHTQLFATGLGAYIVKASDHGDFHRLVLGIVVMSLYVLVSNRVIWRPLYNYAQERFQL